MDAYLQPVDDGLEMNDYGSWTAEKLFYLQRYITMFTTSMRNKPWRRLCFIDLFCGPGKCRNKDSGEIYLGSPLLALTDRYGFDRYIFNDVRSQNIATLKTRCLASDQADKTAFYIGDGNQTVHSVVDEITGVDSKFISGRGPSLNLAFLDPEGLELRWETVARLAQIRKMDLIIYYPEGGLNRFMRQAYEQSHETAVDRFFGGTEWRHLYGKPDLQANLQGHLIALYKDKLKALGYQEVLGLDQIDPLMRNTKKNAPLYRLLFASKHPLGHDFWQKVTKRDSYGQGRFDFDNLI